MRHARRRRWFGRLRRRATVAALAPLPAQLALPPGPPLPPPPVPRTAEGSVEVSKQAELHDVLRGFHAAVDGVHGAVLATRDGLPVASTLGDSRSESVAAMAATVVALADQAVPAGPDGDGGGHTVIRGSGGCLVVYPAGALGVLAVQTAAQPNIGLVQVEAPAAARQLASLLG